MSPAIAQRKNTTCMTREKSWSNRVRRKVSRVEATTAQQKSQERSKLRVVGRRSFCSFCSCNVFATDARVMFT
jgi:hypothetical protein